MRLLVTGGRDYFNGTRMNQELSLLVTPGSRSDLIIHGGASGADSLADDWGQQHGVHTVKLRALWDYYAPRDKEGFPVLTRGSNPAGVIRNGVMLLLKPELCIAFPGGRGTAHMTRLAREAGIEVKEVV